MNELQFNRLVNSLSFKGRNLIDWAQQVVGIRNYDYSIMLAMADNDFPLDDKKIIEQFVFDNDSQGA